MKTRRIFWTIEATRDLEEIIEYISQDKTASAVSLYKTIKSKCLLLHNNPDKYRIVPDFLCVQLYSQSSYHSFNQLPIDDSQNGYDFSLNVVQDSEIS